MRIELNHWYVNGNEISIALLRFCVNISICLGINNSFCFILCVNSDSNKRLYLSFTSLEKAIEFTEKVIVNCESLDEIENVYKKECHRKRR